MWGRDRKRQGTSRVTRRQDEKRLNARMTLLWRLYKNIYGVYSQSKKWKEKYKKWKENREENGKTSKITSSKVRLTGVDNLQFVFRMYAPVNSRRTTFFVCCFFLHPIFFLLLFFTHFYFLTLGLNLRNQFSMSRYKITRWKLKSNFCLQFGKQKNIEILKSKIELRWE